MRDILNVIVAVIAVCLEIAVKSGQELRRITGTEPG